MKKQNRGVLIFLLLLMIMAFMLPPVVTTAGPGVSVWVNGAPVPSEDVELHNGKVFVSVRELAERLGAETRWDGGNKTVRVAMQGTTETEIGEQVTLEEVQAWIEKYGNTGPYYFPGLSFEMAQLDGDGEREIAAKIDGAVNLGQFFIFDRQDGEYRLIHEEARKVEDWNLSRPLNVDGIQMFEVITRTGGTGMVTQNVRLYYLKDGEVKEAWNHVLKDQSFFQDVLSLNMGGYRFHENRNELYAWNTVLKEDVQTGERITEPETTHAIFRFDGTRFVPVP